jgi:chromosome segregation ATPase|tara:strand:+ start:659 stop:1081 length:423 start_codon:yes stop_codon:yes gene_type:complete
MSRTKSSVMTMQELKEKNQDVILSQDEYTAIIERLTTLTNELEQVSENSERNELRVIFYKKEIEDLTAKCIAYKNKIKNKEDVDTANKEIQETMKANKVKMMEKLNSKAKNKYSKKTKEELEAEIRKEFEEFQKTYIDNI